MSTPPASIQTVRPTSAAEAAKALATAAAAEQTVRIAGGGTRRGWGHVIALADVELSTAGLDEIVEHNEGDLTAVLGAGVPLARAQAAFAKAGQMLAVDPPLGAGEAATVGGTVATADSGPYRHRYHALRDLVIGVAVALPDGSVARAGGKVIKNVAGYDLAKLMTGAFGTLGVICEISVRLHPQPAATATVRAPGEDPALLARAAAALAHRPLEPLALDLDYTRGSGAVLARFGGRTAAEQAAGAAGVLREAGLETADVLEDDDALWERQRMGQRAASGGAVVRVAATPRRLATVLGAGEAVGARVIARAAIGTAWVTLPADEPAKLALAIDELRARIAPSPATVLDAPELVRQSLDPWGTLPPATVELMRRVKERFDPLGTCNPGLYMGGI
ncbi:MAG: glycolate oxidase binding subunit [Solirubrobacteraceae bacterium]|nr:glycolate oxidase binding subunit [Solirubrobacteraceae bacterium]